MRAFEKSPPEVQELLLKPIKELGLKIEGSPVEKYVQKLYVELERKGLRAFRPATYLTDEWGCPSEQPIVGIPFYLADKKLAALERTMNDLEDAREIMMYLRHEAGHAFNYAYELYKTDEWRDLFGPFRRPYRDDYRPVPFSRRFVRHMAGWYAQKHPDEDFAETFAVWLTPRSNWRERYKEWPALKKLKYVDRVAKDVADKPPRRPIGDVDFTVEQMETTVEEFYRQTYPAEAEAIANLPLDSDLSDIFLKPSRKKRGIRSACEFIAEHRKEIVDKVAYWSGLRRPLVRVLVEAIEKKTDQQKLVIDLDRRLEHLIDVSAYATTLAMNYVTRGKFIAT